MKNRHIWIRGTFIRGIFHWCNHVRIFAPVHELLKCTRIFWSSWQISSKPLIQLETILKVIVFPVPKNLFQFRTILSSRRAKLHGWVRLRAPTGVRELTTATHKKMSETVLNTWKVSFFSNIASTKKTWKIQFWSSYVHSGFRVGHIFFGTCCRVPVKYWDCA